ncbi:MAG: hypothetical protein ACM3O3_09940 [Syntrophothermus sp.]|nr:hypothetical protein [Ignavibacteriaceae bacterium]
MEDKEVNKKNSPILLLIITLMFLILFSFIPEKTKIVKYETKAFDMLIDVKPDSLLPIEYDLQDENYPMHSNQ